jgi:hypothetical protein
MKPNRGHEPIQAKTPTSMEVPQGNTLCSSLKQQNVFLIFYKLEKGIGEGRAGPVR